MPTHSHAPDVRLRHGDVITVGEAPQGADVIHLRGHTPGSVALSWSDLTGPRTCSRATRSFPVVSATPRTPARADSLYRDVVERVFATHDDDTWFYPGHGDDSTIGAGAHTDEQRGGVGENEQTIGSCQVSDVRSPSAVMTKMYEYDFRSIMAP